MDESGGQGQPDRRSAGIDNLWKIPPPASPCSVISHKLSTPRASRPQFHSPLLDSFFDFPSGRLGKPDGRGKSTASPAARRAATPTQFKVPQDQHTGRTV